MNPEKKISEEKILTEEEAKTVSGGEEDKTLSDDTDVVDEIRTHFTTVTMRLLGSTESGEKASLFKNRREKRRKK